MSKADVRHVYTAEVILNKDLKCESR